MNKKQLAQKIEELEKRLDNIYGIIGNKDLYEFCRVLDFRQKNKYDYAVVSKASRESFGLMYYVEYICKNSFTKEEMISCIDITGQCTQKDNVIIQKITENGKLVEKYFLFDTEHAYLVNISKEHAEKIWADNKRNDIAEMRKELDSLKEFNQMLLEENRKLKKKSTTKGGKEN